MKRIEAFVPSDKVSIVVEALKTTQIGGLTIFSGKGQGKGDRPQVTAGRGTARYIAEYNSIDSIVMIVDDSKLDAVIDAILGAAKTGSKGDGKIFVSSVDEAVDIGSKQKGLQAL